MKIKPGFNMIFMMSTSAPHPLKHLYEELRKPSYFSKFQLFNYLECRKELIREGFLMENSEHFANSKRFFNSGIEKYFSYSK